MEGIGAFPREAHAQLGAVIGAVADAAAYFERWVGFRRRLDDVPGVQVAIAHRGELVASFAVGEADLAAHQPLTTRHLFRIASHSKTFTATAIMQLAERGALRLDDPVRRWVPELDLAVSVRELLQHAGGLTRDGEQADHWQLADPFPDTERLLVMSTAVLARNERFKYSNVGYALLGMIVAAASGQTYEEYVTEHIVEPLGLHDTGPELPPSREADTAVGYTGRTLGDRRVPIGHVHAGAMAAATGFYSTAEDLARYASAHVLGDDRLLTDESKRMMQHAAWEVGGIGSGEYGLGLAVVDIGGRTVVGHGGAYPGYLTRTFIDPVDGFVVCVLTNAIDGPALPYASVFVRLVNLAAETSSETADLGSFEGRFANLWGAFDVCALGGRLRVFDLGLPDPTVQLPVLEVVDADTLRRADDGGYGSPGELVHVERDDDGTITAWRAGGTSYPYDRVAAARGHRRTCWK